ncbi:MAG: uroporphyrinogen-III synthase, partial [Candidatus Acidiferrales bacterium]
VSVVPEDYRAEGLLKALGKSNWRGKRVLLARAAKARDLLPRELKHRGARVDVVAVYRTVVPKASRSGFAKVFGRRKPDAITFTSSSTVRNFFSLLGDKHTQKALRGVAVATIGPVTSRTARALGLKVAVEARTYTVDGLVKAIEGYFGHRKP